MIALHVVQARIVPNFFLNRDLYIFDLHLFFEEFLFSNSCDHCPYFEQELSKVLQIIFTWHNVLLKVMTAM